MTTTDPPSPADPRFDAFADVSMEPGLPEDIAVQIRAGLRRQYDKPPVNETEAVLRANATPDRVRQLIYWPDADDAALYPMLIASPPPGAPKDHPAARCQVTYLMALYLHHAKRWTFVKPFVLAGGLRATADLLVHPNLHLRGQAMEAFGLMTSESLFPWHDPPRPGTSDVAVHQRALELARSPLLPNLAANYDGSFPGGSAAALRILAFFASWLRLRHCPGNVLRLSSELLRLLERWSTRGDGSDDERALAKALRDDFSRFEATDEATTRIDASGTPNVTTSEEAIDSSPARVVLGVDEADACVVVADRTTKLSSSSDAETNDAEASADVDAGESHKKRGNEYFAAGDWSAAIDAYSAAVDAPVSYARLFDEAPRRPSITRIAPPRISRERRAPGAVFAARTPGTPSRRAVVRGGRRGARGGAQQRGGVDGLRRRAGHATRARQGEIQKGDGAVATGEDGRGARGGRGGDARGAERRDGEGGETVVAIDGPTVVGSARGGDGGGPRGGRHETGAVARPDFVAGRRTVNCEDTNRHGETATDEAPSLFASTAVRFGAAEEDERARFVSTEGEATTPATRGSEVSATGVDALGVEGDELYDLD